MNRAVFLDRDGVINRVVLREGRPYPPVSVEQLEWLPGAPEAVTDLRNAGYVMIVVTNQPDVGKGIQRRDVVEAMHDELCRLFPIHEVKVCYHVDQDGCQCRKPRPGLLLEAAARWEIDLQQSFMIGDRWRDIEAGKAAGCKTVWIKWGYAEQDAVGPDAMVTSLSEAAELILSVWHGEPKEGVA